MLETGSAALIGDDIAAIVDVGAESSQVVILNDGGQNGLHCFLFLKTCTEHMAGRWKYTNIWSEKANLL